MATGVILELAQRRDRFDQSIRRLQVSRYSEINSSDVHEPAQAGGYNYGECQPDYLTDEDGEEGEFGQDLGDVAATSHAENIDAAGDSCSERSRLALAAVAVLLLLKQGRKLMEQSPQEQQKP